MARKTVTLTPTWQLVSAVKCVITVNEGKDFIYDNDAANDTNAYRDAYGKGDKFVQNENKDTYMKCENGTIELIVDEA